MKKTPRRGRPPNPRSYIGAAITKAREYAGFDQYEFAAKLGVSQSTVSDWETGRIDPPASRLMAIVKLCKVPLSEYLKCTTEESSVVDPSRNPGELPNGNIPHYW